MVVVDDRGEGAQRSDDIDGAPIGRRVVLGLLGLGAVGVVTGSRLSRWSGKVLAPLAAIDPIGITDLIPGSGAFRIYTVTGDLPKRSRAAWTLRVGGEVARPFTLGFAELADLEPTSITADFQCVTGWRVDDVRWKGVRLADLLERAGVTEAGTHVRFTSFDGTYTESLSLDQARRDDVLVAYEMLGGPVTSEHGGPVRLYVAPMYGYKSLKWLDGIEVTSELVPGYWEERGYDVDGWVGGSNGRGDAPIDL